MLIWNTSENSVLLLCTSVCEETVYYIHIDNTDKSVVCVSLTGNCQTSFTANLMSLKPKISYAEFGGCGYMYYSLYIAFCFPNIGNVKLVILCGNRSGKTMQFLLLCKFLMWVVQ